MRILLDTHIFIWWNGDLGLLSSSARSLCEDQENTLALSLASIWEMQIKRQLGKLTFNRPLPEIIQSQQRANGIELLPITTEHIFALQNLPAHHRDPFDRILIAQAHVERISLITADPAFRQYEVKLLG
jgi:PIN domain nuclease of toxin-antitoxin system